MSKRSRNASAFAAAALALIAVTAAAQNDGVPPPPRIDDVPPPPRIDAEPAGAATQPRPPVRTRLAPLPAERATQDEIVVIGQQGFRLPDLGSSWRAEQEAERNARIRVSILPLYDPEAERLANDLFLVNREAQRRHGVIELFRVRFGRRDRE